VCLRVGISWFVAAARGECEGGNQKEEKFCLFHIACDFIIWGSVSTKADNCPNERELCLIRQFVEFALHLTDAPHLPSIDGKAGGKSKDKANDAKNEANVELREGTHPPP